MTRRLGVVLIACSLGVGLLALTAFAVASSAHAQSADLVLRDRVTAEPNDPDKPKDVRGTASIVQSDIATATKFCKIAAAQSRRALYQVGVMMAEGTGGPKDDVGARALFENAAAQGDPDAMLWSGAFAQIGRGGPQKTSAAKAYFQKAAALGNDEPKQRLKDRDCPYVLKNKNGRVRSHLCF